MSSWQTRGPSYSSNNTGVTGCFHPTTLVSALQIPATLGQLCALLLVELNAEFDACIAVTCAFWLSALKIR